VTPGHSLLLGVVRRWTEFLPVSSSGPVVLAGRCSATRVVRRAVQRGKRALFAPGCAVGEIAGMVVGGAVSR